MVGNDKVDDAGSVEVGSGTGAVFCPSGRLEAEVSTTAEGGGSFTGGTAGAALEGARLGVASAVCALVGDESTMIARDIRAAADRGFRPGMRDRSGFIVGPPIEA
jgi:hypothetical protein